MTRIIAGTAKGRTLKVPTKGTRPTSDRLRESLFSRLDHWGVIRGAHVLDLYAGSGALGLEAASRGAERVYVVDSSRESVRVMKENARVAGFTPMVHISHSDVRKFLLSHTGSTLRNAIDLVFVDPPYSCGALEVQEVLSALVPLLRADSLIVVERSSHSAELDIPSPLELEEQRTLGDTTLWFIGAARPPEMDCAADALPREEK